MKLLLAAATIALLSLNAPRARALDVGSDGLSGNFNPTSSVQIDLSLAVTGDLSTPGNVNGVYDPVRWAVIFKYASVNIPSGVTVTFKNHPSGAPVVWLVQGNATIEGLVNLDSSAGNSLLQKSPGGPGGFAGGKGAFTSPGAAGSGPGGGAYAGTKGGSYGTLGTNVTTGTYGSPEILPLIGGSGGAGSSSWSGTGGGGAILLASNGVISLGITSSVKIQANGAGANNGGGSGGGIRLLAASITGSGSLQALGGSGYNYGGMGRIRVEANSISIPAGSSPAYSVVSPLTGSELTFPPVSAPTIRVSAINGVPVSATPNGEQTVPTDINLTVQAPVQVDLLSANVPSGSTVTLRVVPFEGADQTYTAAANGANAWRALNVVLPASGVASMVARAVLP